VCGACVVCQAQSYIQQMKLSSRQSKLMSLQGKAARPPDRNVVVCLAPTRPTRSRPATASSARSSSMGGGPFSLRNRAELHGKNPYELPTARPGSASEVTAQYRQMREALMRRVDHGR
jgi:hypothetical protein